jgi:hypothetical protein
MGKLAERRFLQASMYRSKQRERQVYKEQQGATRKKKNRKRISLKENLVTGMHPHLF